MKLKRKIVLIILLTFIFILVAGTFNTISARTIDKITSSTSYVSHLYEYKEATPSKVIVDENSSKNASVTEITPESGFDGTTFTFKVTVEEGYELVAVKVNGEVELQRGKKLRNGDIVEYHGEEFTIVSPFK